jgi:hypothetical protein
LLSGQVLLDLGVEGGHIHLVAPAEGVSDHGHVGLLDGGPPREVMRGVDGQCARAVASGVEAHALQAILGDTRSPRDLDAAVVLVGIDRKHLAELLVLSGVVLLIVVGDVVVLHATAGALLDRFSELDLLLWRLSPLSLQELSWIESRDDRRRSLHLLHVLEGPGDHDTGASFLLYEQVCHERNIILTSGQETSIKQGIDEVGLDIREIRAELGLALSLGSQVLALLDKRIDVLGSDGLKDGVEERPVRSEAALPLVGDVGTEVRELNSVGPDHFHGELWPGWDLVGVVHVPLVEHELLAREALLEKVEGAVVLLGDVVKLENS